MYNFKLNVIFHKTIHDCCYSELNKESLSRINFVAVNPNIPKTYAPNYNVIKEWEFPLYLKDLQERGFKENSVLYHFYKNKSIEESHVGFCQYDMSVKKDFFQEVERIIQEHPKSILALKGGGEYRGCLIYTSPNFPIDLVLKSYNNFFKTNKTIEDLSNSNNKFPMLNTYIIPTNMFYKMGSWLEHIMEELFNYDTQNIAGYLERVTATFLALENVKTIDIEHVLVCEDSLKV